MTRENTSRWIQSECLSPTSHWELQFECPKVRASLVWVPHILVLAPPVYFVVSFVVFHWVLIEIDLDLCGRYKGCAKTMIYTNTHKRLLTKTIYWIRLIICLILWGRLNRIPSLEIYTIHPGGNFRCKYSVLQQNGKIRKCISINWKVQKEKKKCID